MTDVRRLPLPIRIALRAYPQRFRDAFAEEMEEDIREALSECRTRVQVWRCVFTTALGFVRSGLSERWRPALHANRVMSTGRAAARWPDHLPGDLRVAVRSLAKRPGFTMIAVVTLALGIGSNTAIFSVVSAVLLRQLEWEDPDGLITVWAHDAENSDRRGSMSLPDTRDIEDLPAVETLIGYRGTTATVTGGDEPLLVDASRSTDGLMATFRVQPLLGRDLTKQDAEVGSPWVVVVGHRYWQERLGGRQDVIGGTVEISDVPFEIVGVAPPGFDFPDGAQLWWPRQIDVDGGCGRGCHTLLTIGRLSPGTSIEALSAQLGTLAANLSDAYPESNFEKQFRGMRLVDATVEGVRLGLWFILGAVSLVLLIACANVANLLLVRGESRRGEVAVRAALGASRMRIVSQVMMESVVLTAGGVGLGLVFARLGIGLVRAMPAGTVPRIETVALDGRVLLFALAVAVVVTVLFGMSPALRLARGLTAQDLVSERRGGAGPRAKRSRSLLLATEVALSVLLLVGAGLLLKTFDRLYRVDMGFEAENLTRFRISLPGSRYDTIDRIVTFYNTLEERLRSLPGVISVGSSYGPPLGSGDITGEVLIEGRPRPEPGAELYGSMHSVTPSYLETMRMPLLRGRAIEGTDRTGTLPVAVVSQTFVDQNFPGEDPLGKRFEVTADFGYGSPMWTIIGVVGDVRRTPTHEPEPDVYVPLGQYGPESLTLTMRTSAGVMTTAAAIRDAVRSIDPGLPIQSLETVQAALNASVAPTRFYLLTMTVFAGLALVLACVGLYGVVAYLVTRRTREIGIRIALGAHAARVIRMVIAQGIAPALAGLVIGLLLALALGRVAESLLFELVSPRDPVIMAGVAVVLLLATLTAVFLPALRASRVQPVEALRGELP
ncbi:MAG: ABC transporter permease [Gemmatimonadetes bacterium]|nr:ABC transporter permease [Gemmatimonadota bacterium]